MSLWSKRLRRVLAAIAITIPSLALINTGRVSALVVPSSTWCYFDMDTLLASCSAFTGNNGMWNWDFDSTSNSNTNVSFPVDMVFWNHANYTLIYNAMLAP